MCTISHHAIIPVDSATTRVPAYRHRISARSSVSAVASARIDSPVADAKPSATRNNVHAI